MSQSPVGVLVVGSRGRMGQAIAAAATASENAFRVVGGVDAGDDAASAVKACDVIIDFSSHQATAALLAIAVRERKPIVIGTTGHPAAEKAVLLKEAAKVPCVWAGNFSVGVNLLFALTRKAAAVLGSDYDVELTEMHHRFKQDAPSGTAARLLEIVREERARAEGGAGGAAALRHGREGIVGARPKGEIGVHALRGGDVVGDHTVMFAALGERIELSHKASDRQIFARGALRAARWVRDQPPGLYDMQDVLSLK